jgi:hypothetical protein
MIHLAVEKNVTSNNECKDAIVGYCYLLGLFIISFFVQHLFLKKKSYILYIFRIILFFFLGYQVLWLSEHSKTMPEKRSEKTRQTKNSLLGFVTPFNEHGNYNTVIFNNDTVYHVQYSTDSYGRRISEELSDTLIKKDKHAVFIGCSYTFGEGLSYSSTTPSLFEQANLEYKSYNYGIRGGGPHQFALLFNDGINTINRSSIKETEGFALYTYYIDHMDRVYGSSNYYRWAPYSVPDVYVENDSLIVKRKSLLHLFLCEAYNKIRLLKPLGLRMEIPKTEKFQKRFAGIVDYMAKKYWEINPNGNFYVGVYPGSSYNLEWVPFLNPKIKVIIVDNPADYFQNIDKYRILNDTHPTKKFNEYYIKEITKFIQENEQP